MSKKKKYNFEQVVIDKDGNESPYEGSLQQQLNNKEKTYTNRLDTLKNNSTIAEKEFDKKNQLWKNKIIDNRNDKSKQMLSYNDKFNKKTDNTELITDNNKAISSAKKEYEEKEKARNNFALADYLYNSEKYSDRNYNPGAIQSVYDKTLGRAVRGAGEMLLNFGGRENEKYTDENGKTTYLPSALELKNQAVRKTYSDNIVGKTTSVLGDVLEGGGKIAAATALDAITLGYGGTLAYKNDLAKSAYKNAINSGATNNQAVANAGINALSEIATGKLIGSATKGLTKLGGNTLADTASGSAFENLLEKGISKGIKNKTASKLLASGLSETTEEGLQEYLGALNDKLTLGKDIDLKETTKNAGYSALVGGLTGGLVKLPTAVRNARIQNVLDIEKKVNNKEITPQQGLVALEQVKSGTYEQNNMIEQIAQQKVQEVQQAVQQGIITPQEATQEINAITQTLNQQRNSIVDTLEQSRNNSNNNLDNLKINEKPSITEDSKNNIQVVPTKDIIEKYESGGSRTNQYNNILKENIKREGIKTPIIVSSETGKILDGNHRLQIANELGIQNIPVKYVDSSNEIDFDNSDWYNHLKGEWDEKRKTTPSINERMQDERINNNRSDEIIKGSSSDGQGNQLYSGIQGDVNRSSIETVHGTDTTMGGELDNSSFSNEKQTGVVESKQKINTPKSYLTEEEQKELKQLKMIDEQGLLDGADLERLNKLEKKSNGIITKFDGLKVNNKYEDIKREYGKYKNKSISKENVELIDKAKDVITANKQGRRTVDEWKQVARFIGQNSKAKTNAELQELALTSWFNERPNQKENLNRQGKKYAKFGVDEWVNEIYKGAGVGEDSKLYSVDNLNDLKINEKQSITEDSNTFNFDENNDGNDKKNVPGYMEQNKNNIVYDIDLDKQKRTDTLRLQSPTATSSDKQNISQSNKNVKSDISNNSNMQENKNNSNILNEKKYDDVLTLKTAVENFNNALSGKSDYRELRSWVATSNNATDNQNTINQADIDKITYEVQSNKKTYEQASNNLSKLSYEQKVERSNQKLNSNKRITAVDITEAQLALREAATKGDIKTYLNLQQDIAIMGTELGQTVQAMSMIQKMSPDGQLAMLNKIVDRQQKLGNKNWDNIKLDENLVQEILDSYDDDTHTTYNKEKMDQAVDKLKQNIADQIGTTKAEKFNEWRYLSMLGNPKTHIRNVVANTAMSGVKTIKDTFNATAQDIFIKDKTNKTTTLKLASKDVKEYAKELSDKIYKGEQTNKYNEKNDIESKKRIFKNGLLETARKGNAKALDFEDRLFKEKNFKKSFAKYLTAQGIKTKEDIRTNPKIIEQAKIFAMEEAKIATFQQDSELANKINSFDNLGPVAKVVRGAIIPFTRTPLNIAKTGIEYTPGVGLLKTISDVKKVPSNQKAIVAIDGISKQITGTSLALLGYALAKSGIVTSDSGDDKEDKLKSDQGMKMDYSIKLGNTSYDLSWLSPSSMPFFVGATMYEQLEKIDGWDGNVVMEALAGTIDPLSEMSCVSSMTKTLKSYSKEDGDIISNIGKSTVQSYLSQFVPTVSSQFARLFDDTKRSTYADKNSSFTFGEETAKQLMYKIPGVRNLLPEQTDYLGNNRKENENIAIRAFESFLSPSNTKTDTSNKITKKLLKLYEETGENGILPGKLDQYIQYKNEKYNMTQKEYNQFKKDFGKFAYSEIQNAMNSDKYKSLSKDEQAEVVSNIMKYSKYKAKQNYFDTKDIEYSSTTFSKANKAEDSGYAIADFYITKEYTKSEKSTPNTRNRYQELANKGIDGETFDNFKYFISSVRADKDSNGNSIKGSKKQKIINYINSLSLSAQEKQNLYQDYQDNQGMFSYYK